MINLLIIEDERLLGSQLRDRFERKGWQAALASNLGVARQLLFEDVFDPDVVLSDMNLPDGNGLDLLEDARGRGVKGEWVFVSGYGLPPDINRALDLGAIDFLDKPIDEDRLDIAMSTAARGGRALRRIDAQARTSARAHTPDSYAGQSEAAQSVRALLAKLARVPFSSLLIQGETGTGKGLVARILHYGGPRSAQPFVEFNCAAMPAELLESELFGHEAGAFSGSRGRHRGLFEQADGGTLFLDEIGEMDLAMQGKLLKAIEEKEFRRVGGEKPVRVDIQVLSASNRDLVTEVAEQRFREDLFHRLSVIEIALPPLRARIADIDSLVPRIIDEFNARSGRSVKRVEPDLMKRMRAYRWPGNVRELRNVLERGVLLSEGDELTGEDVVLERRSTPEATARPHENALVVPCDGSVSLDEAERRLIAAVLERQGGNVLATARVLGTTREKLRYRLQKHGLHTGESE